ncbi:MAG: DGQHR domain-containing protein [Spirochaetaceae bacterium]|nr:DGQHR domain-containing protein [Spirochaetaceae bacterium]
MADLIPVIRGNMGGREYYIGKMTFQELAAKVGFYSDLDESRDLDTLLQRELSKRSEEMTEYLLRQRERFYGAIIVAAWGGRPNYIKVRMEDHPLLDDDFEFGLLKFDGRQLYFALDGQHRLKSIKGAIEQNGDLRNEEVSVVFVTHDRTDDGNIQTRRLFHTLNRYARPTTTGENIALDEDNVVSIATRMLLKSGIKCFSVRYIELVKKNLTKTQSDKFTSLAALYDFNYAVLDAVYNFKSDKDYLRYRPDALHIDRMYNGVMMLWNEIRERTAVFRGFESEARTAGDIREPQGLPSEGNLLFRPLGVRIYGSIIASALAEQREIPLPIGAEVSIHCWERALDRVDKLTLTLGEAPWRGTIFRNNKMETSARNLATRIACYMLGIGQQSEEKLLNDYRGYLEDSDAQLPKKLGA